MAEKTYLCRVNRWKKGGAQGPRVGEKRRGHVADYRPVKPTRPLTQYLRLTDLLSDGCNDLEGAKQIMAYHGTTLDSLCRHKEFKPPYKTISSVFYLPQRKEALFSGGYPCVAEYQKVVWE